MSFGRISGVSVIQVMCGEGYSFLNRVSNGVDLITSPMAPNLMIRMRVSIFSYSSQEEQILSRNLLGMHGISPLKYLQSNFISDSFIQGVLLCLPGRKELSVYHPSLPKRMETGSQL